MKKQEVMKILTDTKHDYEFCWSDDFRTGFIEGIDCSLKAINQLNEPEKPILTKEEAEWLEGLKEALLNPSKTRLAYFITRQGWGYLFEYKEKFEGTKRVLNPELYPNNIYPEDLKERLLNAALYGYEVEKEKLYTAKFKASNEYLNLDRSYKELYFIKVSKDIAEKCSRYHFTKEKLIECSVWNNSAFEIEEVVG